MGLFDLFKKPRILEDDFFGTLKFISFSNPAKDYFEGKGIFKPTGDTIEYFIKGDVSGPTRDQREFYTRIQDRYEELMVKVVPLIEEEFKNRKDELKITDFKKAIRVVSITLPRLSKKPVHWDMSFESRDEDSHQLTIDFIDFEPDPAMLEG